MSGIVLTSTLHDPEASLKVPLEKALSAIKENYREWVVAVTPDTSQEIVKVLEENGVEVVVQGEAKLSADLVEDNHLKALEGGLKKTEKGDQIQYIDGDRIIFGAAYFPEEVEKVTDLIKIEYQGADYISLTRSPEDVTDHHNSLILTEQSLTRVYRQALGAEIDPASTAHVFSPAAGQFILDHSAEREVMRYPHGKWSILAKEGNFKIDSLETEKILSFETPLQFREASTMDAFIDGSFTPDLAQELRTAYSEGKLPSAKVLREYFRHLAEADNQRAASEWQHRIALAEDWIDFLAKEIPQLDLAEQEIKKLESVISSERQQLEKIRETNLSERAREVKMR